MRVALALSLGLNLLVAGTVAGSFLGARPGPPRPPDDIGRGMIGPYGRAFSDEDKAALRSAIREELPQLRENRAAVRKLFDELQQALRAEPYDHARVTAIVEAQHQRLNDQVTRMRGVMLDRLAGMTHDERVGFADRLAAELRHGPRRGKDHRPPRP